MAQTIPGRNARHIKYDAYVSAVQRCATWTGGVGGGLFAFVWAYTEIGLGAGLLFGVCGAFAGTLIAVIASWLLVPHVLVISLGVLAAAALPFGLIWLVGLLWRIY